MPSITNTTNKHEKQFYQALEDLFVGAKIEGAGGYVNLLQIKSAYYKVILAKFKEEVEQNAILRNSAAREEFFDRLYSFFRNYFSENGSVYFCKTAYGDKKYERVYTDDKDVILFWKTNMLYYVKSDILFKNIVVSVEGEEGVEHKFAFDCSTLLGKQNNEKKELIFTYDKHGITSFSAEPAHVLKVNYASGNQTTKLENIAKKSKLSEGVVEKAIRIFKKQNSVDFFINKDAKGFLSEQLDLYLHKILLDDKNAFTPEKLQQIKTVKEFASKIIDFISQFENELVRVWNKPKFVLNSNYVISLDKLSRDIIEKIAKSEGLSAQIEEWQEFGMVDNNFSFAHRDSTKHAHLPIDTKHFKELESEILEQFENLDEALDGRLIHSENYQALNTLKDCYKEQVQCVYIDPPFNTGKDFQYVDGFQDSTWCTLMGNRFDAVGKLLKDDSSFFLHLDERADYYGRILLEGFHFDSIKQITFHTMAATDEMASTFGMKNVSSRNFVQESQTIFYGRYQSSKFFKLWKPNRRTSELGIGGMDLIALLKQGGSAKAKDGYDFYIEKYKDKNLELVKIPQAQAETIYTMGDIWNDILSMSQSTVRQHGENISFQGQKPEELLRRVIQTSTEKGDIVLDYFAGTGTTAAVAHKLSRKWITIEQGTHFNNFYIDIDEKGIGVKKLGCLGRLKQVVMGDQTFKVPNSEYNRSSCLSREINWQGGGFFKYYDLEQYEQTLNHMHYACAANPALFNSKNPFENYMFLTDTKLADVLDVKKDDKSAEYVASLDFDQLYQNIDFAETISLLKGLPIKQIKNKMVTLADGKSYSCDFSKMNSEEKVSFAQMLKPLLWWGEE